MTPLLSPPSAAGIGRRYGRPTSGSVCLPTPVFGRRSCKIHIRTRIDAGASNRGRRLPSRSLQDGILTASLSRYFLGPLSARPLLIEGSGFRINTTATITEPGFFDLNVEELAVINFACCQKFLPGQFFPYPYPDLVFLKHLASPRLIPWHVCCLNISFASPRTVEMKG